MNEDNMNEGDMNADDTHESNDAEIEENWDKLDDAISGGDVNTVQTLLTMHPSLVHYRDDEYVSPPNNTHEYL
jgi:hypothetical protein